MNNEIKVNFNEDYELIGSKDVIDKFYNINNETKHLENVNFVEWAEDSGLFLYLHQDNKYRGTNFLPTIHKLIEERNLPKFNVLFLDFDKNNKITDLEFYYNNFINSEDYIGHWFNIKMIYERPINNLFSIKDTGSNYYNENFSVSFMNSQPKLIRSVASDYYSDFNINPLLIVNKNLDVDYKELINYHNKY